MSKMVKTIVLFFGGLLTLLVLIAIIVPLVVDVDKYRPQIVKVADDNINGKVQLGKLSLSLWGQIRVEVAGVKVSDAQNREILSVSDSYFHVPLMSIFSGAPLLTFKMLQPTVHVIKDQDGKLNVMTLMKSAASTPPQAAQESKSIALPAIAASARLGVELRNALISYKDLKTGLDSEIKDFNLVLHDISLSHPTEMEAWADIDTRMGKTMTVKGPFKFTAEAKPEFSGGKFTQATVKFNANFDDLEIIMPGLFEKKKGIAANADGLLMSSESEAKIDHIDAKFYNADIKATGTITNLKAAPGSSPIVDLTVKSNEIALKPWADLIPMLKNYDLGGTVLFDARANGPSDKIGYHANLVVNALTAKAPNLKSEPRIDGYIKVATDQIEDMSFTMKAPANELNIRGKLVSFTSPRVEMQITSPGMDLDQLINFPPPKAKASAAAAPAESGGEAVGEPAKAAAGGAKSDMDAMLDPIRENKMIANTSAVMSLNIKMLKAYGVKMTDMTGKMSFRDLAASVDQFGLGVFAGKLKMSASTQMRPKAPTYRFDTKVADLDMKQAVESQMALFKNTVLGKASFQMSGAGASYNTDQAKSNLTAKGNLKVVNATFASIDVGKMVSEGLNKSIDKIGEKIPQLKGKSIKSLPEGSSKYSVISSDFTITGGVFSAPNFVAKAEPNQGVDLSGTTTVNLKTNALATHWEIIDTYNLTHAKDLSVNQAGVDVPQILAEKGKPVQFPVSAGCTISAPCYSYTQVAEALGKVALNNVAKGLTGKASAEAQNRVKDLTKAAPPAVQDAIQGFGKKLFGQ